MPDAVHCANVLKHFGIWAWNNTVVVHSSKFGPHTSADSIHDVYASIHSALSNKLDDVVVVVPTVLIYAVIVGIRDATVPITLGRAVNANAAGTTHKTAINPIVFFNKLIRLTPFNCFKYNTKTESEKEKYDKNGAKNTKI